MAAYRSIPYAILTPNQEIIDTISTMSNDNPEVIDLTDTQIENMINERGKKIFATLTPVYQKAAKETIQEILKANNSKGNNILLETLSPELLKSFG